MAKNFNGTQINNSATIVEKAGAEIADCRNKIMKYDGNGNVVLATAGTDIPVGVALIEAGYNDISGAESGKVAIGDDVDILVKDIGFVLTGAAITKGQEITATETMFWALHYPVQRQTNTVASRSPNTRKQRRLPVEKANRKRRNNT